MSGYDKLTVGQHLSLEKSPITTEQLVRYAGASGDFNRIHYDEPFAKAGGFPSVIAHGMLTLGFFGELLGQFVERGAEIKRLHSRFRAVTFPGDVIRCDAEVVAVDQVAQTVELSLRACKSDGTVTVEGGATLCRK